MESRGEMEAVSTTIADLDLKRYGRLGECHRARAKRSRSMASQGPLCSEAKRDGSHLWRWRSVPARHEEPTTEEGSHGAILNS